MNEKTRRPLRRSTSSVSSPIFNWPRLESVEEAPPEIPKTEEVHVHHSKSHFIYNVCMDLGIVIIAGLEAGLVVAVALTHFLKYTSDEYSAEIEAGFISLLPLFYNFIGVIFFLSSKRERVIIERIFPDRPYLTDIFQLPLIGPFLTTLTVFIKGWSQNKDYASYERLEASATKLRQAVTFFSSSPEAMVQLSMLIVNKKDVTQYYLEIVTIFVAIFAIAEANVYGIVSDYYKLFQKSDEKSWKAAHAIKFSQKMYLFLHAFFSIATNLLSRTFLTNAAVEIFENFNSSFVILLFFFLQTLVRQIIFYVASIIKYLVLGETMPSVFYDSFNYGWRTAILNTDFQSDSKLNQAWFYLENGAGFVIWYLVTAHRYDFDGVWAPNEEIFIIFSGIFLICFVLSIAGLLLTRYFLKLNALQNFLFSSKSLFTNALGIITPSGNPPTPGWNSSQNTIHTLYSRKDTPGASPINPYSPYNTVKDDSVFTTHNKV